MFENIISFAFGGLVFFLVGMGVGEGSMKGIIEQTKIESIETGYTKAYTDQLGKDVGIPVAKCKLSGGESVVNGKRVACLKEMTND